MFDPNSPSLLNLDNLVSYDLKLLAGTKLQPLSPQLTKLLINARANIAQLNGYCLAVPNPYLILSPSILRESLASSEIENIQTTLIEALQSALFPEIERREPDKEVLRYSDAVMWGFGQIQSGLPIVSRIITGIQDNLMPNQGGYRTSQNIIWNPTTKEIILVPPKANELPDFIKDWENFVNTEDELDPLIKIAIAHYQFESIHPFNDGNGRTGRILMVLELVQKQLLSLPILYLSGYIVANKSAYYQALQSVRKTGDWEQYLEFILLALATQAKATSQTFLDITQLLIKQKKDFKSQLPKIYSHELLEELFNSPIVSPVSLGRKLNIHYTTASKYLKAMTSIGILTTTKVGKNQFYINSELITLLTQK